MHIREQAAEDSGIEQGTIKHNSDINYTPCGTIHDSDTIGMCQDRERQIGNSILAKGLAKTGDRHMLWIYQQVSAATLQIYQYNLRQTTCHRLAIDFI